MMLCLRKKYQYVLISPLSRALQTGIICCFFCTGGYTGATPKFNINESTHIITFIDFDRSMDIKSNTVRYPGMISTDVPENKCLLLARFGGNI